MPSRDHNQQTTHNYCAKQVKKVKSSLHKKSCEKSCPQGPNVFCKTQFEMDLHTVTKHAIASMIAKTKCKICKEEYPSFYSLQRNKKLVHGTT